MSLRHKLLERQIKRYLKKTLQQSEPAHMEELENFFQAVSLAYSDFDSDRLLTERVQDLVSAELGEEQRIAEIKSLELEKLNSTLLETQEKLVHSSKMSALGEMAGGVAHEINNPLAIIQMRAENLLLQIKQPTMNHQYCENSIHIILTTCQRIAKIVSGLKVFARDEEKGKLEIVPVRELVEQSFSLCWEKFKSHGVQLDYQDESKAAQHLAIECRAVQIGQVFVNILNNAFDAIENLKNKWIEVRARDLGPYVEITISDSGPGIPLEIQQKVMEPFFTTKDLGKGTGLGLSISSGIIRSHGGMITIDNQSNHTKIVVQLPKRQRPATDTSAH